MALHDDTVAADDNTIRSVTTRSSTDGMLSANIIGGTRRSIIADGRSLLVRISSSAPAAATSVATPAAFRMPSSTVNAATLACAHVPTGTAWRAWQALAIHAREMQ